MISMTELAKRHQSAASVARLRKRKAAQTRMVLAGITAILLSALALAVLLSSVFTKATGAVSENYIRLPVTLNARDIDPADIRRANFGGVAKNVLKATFPYVSGRSNKREMYDVISSGAAFELREQVMQNPDLIGQSIEFDFLASDIADLYLKGSYGAMRDVDSAGELTVSRERKTALVSNSAADFEPLLTGVRTGLREQAARLREQARLQENGRAVFEQRAAAGEEPEANTAEAARRAAKRDQLLAQATEIEALADQPDATLELGPRMPSVLLRAAGGWIKLETLSPDAGSGIFVGDVADAQYAAGDWQLVIYDTPEALRKISDLQAILLENLSAQGRIEQKLNAHFFAKGDSREPELAGVWGAVVGSFWTMLVTITFAFFIGVPAAIYLEEFASDTRFTRFVEININNLAAVPSIVFGLLGLAVFIGFFGMGRSSPMVGGVVLGIMTLPIIIIAARAAIKAVPPSIRDGALALGASDLQVSLHHVLPLSMPGILTGTILGMARALGETAPLIMIGMVAFIVDIPQGPTDNATVLPVQIYRWSDFPERAFEARTAAAIVVLLVFLFAMNGLAIVLRKRFERRW